VNLITLLGDKQVFGRTRAVIRDLTVPVAVWIVVVDIAALGVFALLLVSGQRFGNPYAVAGLALVAACGERGRITLRVTDRGSLNVSISLLPAISAAVLFGPTAALAVYGVSAVALEYPLAGRASYMGSRALTGAMAGGAALGTGSLVSSGVGRIVVEAAVAAFVAEATDTVFGSVTFALRGFGRWTQAARDSLPVIAGSVPFYSSAVAILALAYDQISGWTLPLFFAPALAAQRWFVLYQDQRRLSEDLQVANDQLRAANLSFAKGLIATLDARDRYTAGHSAAVAVYAADIARRMALSSDEIQLAFLCGLVHDIGKIGLPAGLLEKPGALTLEERREMQRHSEIGERILANVDTYAEISAIVRHHHERVDGQGYPDGLDGEGIPLLSRIIAVADAYNAMTSDRPYRDAMPSRVARLRLAQAVETQFDTSVVAAFEAILAGATEDYRLGHGAPFRLETESVPADRPLLVAAIG
jgi:putative nucleotidyltransferase with HDIG domain